MEAVGLAIPPREFSSHENPLEEDLSTYLTAPDDEEFFQSLNAMLAKDKQLKTEDVLSFDRSYVRRLIHDMIEQHARVSSFDSTFDSIFHDLGGDHPE